MFVAIARHRYLESLKLPRIRTPWVPETTCVVNQPFLSLKCLRAYFTHRQLHRTMPYFKNLKWLELTLEGTSDSALQSLLSMPHLSHLKISFVKTTNRALILGRDLLHFVKSCSSLTSLMIGGEHPGQTNLGRVLVDGVSDTIFKELAQSLPKLHRLHLSLRGHNLSYHTLIHLGNYCKYLKDLNISANVDFSELAQWGSKYWYPMLFPKLYSLRIDQNLVAVLPVSSPEKVEQVAKEILQIMPKCRIFRSGYKHPRFEADNQQLDSVIKQLRLAANPHE